VEHVLHFPVRWFLLSVFVLWLSSQIGASLRRRWPLKDDEREDFVVGPGRDPDAAWPHHQIQFLDGDQTPDIHLFSF